ncbi:hypothetical protein A2Z22_01945 [Candidatus Woesebacteria bacterium RBG_16_34_12]|uniref:Uncharacterized protein n=1 Tax=Candidatus Woesebacteria bacterium RBG_16_34_12 TaxID=1802480 RepID=A0A1F7XAL5_9BACT|nr:MAG: hypothetical protein A2Z22_01945 [Candidatus Woesebacteria bacterium RBG_16_34_12]
MDTSTFTPELILGIIGTVTGILSLIISLFFTRKAIKQADKALEQSDKNLITQLLYEDKKRALMKLQSIIDGTKLVELRVKLDTFFKSIESSYVPRDVSNRIYNMLEELEKFEDENAAYPTKRKMDEEEAAFYEASDPLGGMTEFEQFEYEFGEKINSFKHSSNYIIKESLNKF